jgi:hypothetical protein
MGHRIEFEFKRRVILLSFFNVVTEDSFLAGLTEAITFVRANGMEGAIVDLSDIEVFQVSMDFIRNYVNTREIVEPTKPRFVVASQPAIYGTFRAFQIHAESSSVFPIPVRTMAEAYRLLKLDSPVFGPEPWSGPVPGNSK